MWQKFEKIFRKMELKKVKVLELFSGIGGMHYSLCRAKQVLNELYRTDESNGGTGEVANPKIFDFEVVSAIDISEVANRGKFLYKTDFCFFQIKVYL